MSLVYALRNFIAYVIKNIPDSLLFMKKQNIFVISK